RARRRGAPCVARIDGYAAGFEPTLTHRDRQSIGLRETMQRALSLSGHRAGEIDLVMTSAHGTAVDATEREALAGVFDRARSPLLFAPKSAWGECWAANGVLSLAIAASFLRAPGLRLADGIALQLDPTGVSAAPDASARVEAATLAMVHALCYSGPTVALVL